MSDEIPAVMVAARVEGHPLAVLVITDVGMKLEDAGISVLPDAFQDEFFAALPALLRAAADEYEQIGRGIL